MLREGPCAQEVLHQQSEPRWVNTCWGEMPEKVMKMSKQKCGDDSGFGHGDLRRVTWPAGCSLHTLKTQTHTEWPRAGLVSHRNSPPRPARVRARPRQDKGKSQISLPTLWVPQPGVPQEVLMRNMSSGEFPQSSETGGWAPRPQPAGLPGPGLLGSAVGSWRKQALIVPLCLAAQWEPVSRQQLYAWL